MPARLTVAQEQQRALGVEAAEAPAQRLVPQPPRPRG